MKIRGLIGKMVDINIDAQGNYYRGILGEFKDGVFRLDNYNQDKPIFIPLSKVESFHETW